MNILVACEESQAVTIKLRRLGHTAYSCDIIPCSGGHPEWHISLVEGLARIKVHKYCGRSSAKAIQQRENNARMA